MGDVISYSLVLKMNTEPEDHIKNKLLWSWLCCLFYPTYHDITWWQRMSLWTKTYAKQFVKALTKQNYQANVKI